jgi:hypothetical protein
MKNKIKYFFISFSVVILSIIKIDGQVSNETQDRWDLKMINEEPIWRNLLVHYFNGEPNKSWFERKSALNDIIINYPRSQWADDAALLLAGGKASFEHDINGAIKDLKKIIDIYPNGSTILTSWDVVFGFTINSTWLMWAPDLVIENADGKMVSYPFDRDNKLSILELEALEYFNHLEKNPNLTKDIAMYAIIQMTLAQNDRVDAIALLEDFVVKNQKISKIKEKDYEASKNKYGYLISNELPNEIYSLWRVHYPVYLLLEHLYQENGEVEKATNLAKKTIKECGTDGWLWFIKLKSSEILEMNNNFELANEQYSDIENSICEKVKSESVRLNELHLQGYAQKPDSFTSWENIAKEKYDFILKKLENKKKK